MSRTVRLAYWACCAWAVATIWLAPHLPQTDLPQHAGQVALMRDLAAGRSAWAPELRINLLTPYLVGYASLYALSQVLPLETAIALLYSVAYVAFVLACIGLRREVGADERLDWLFLPVFFGLAWRWGFLTFLVAAPVGICLLIATYRFARTTTWRLAMLIAVLGILALFSHGLVFLYAAGVGLLVVLAAKRGARERLVAALPFVVLLLGFLAYKVTVLDVEMSRAVGSSAIEWGDAGRRLLALVVYPTAATPREFYPAPLVALVAYASPWLLGLKPAQSAAAAVPFACTFLMMLLLPTSVWDAGFLYDRFALFLLPTYALMFTRRRRPAPAAPAAEWKAAVVQAALVLGSAAVLARETVFNLAFARESRDADELFARLEPGRRLLYVPRDKGSERVALPHAYLHYPLWYQARHGGLVEFNFAILLPQVVRYRDEGQHLKPGFPWLTEEFRWQVREREDFRYVLFRSATPIPLAMLESSRCPLLRVESAGAWAVFRNTCSR